MLLPLNHSCGIKTELLKNKSSKIILANDVIFCSSIKVMVICFFQIPDISNNESNV